MLIDVVRYGFVINQAVDGGGHTELIPRQGLRVTRTEAGPPQQVVNDRVKMRHVSLSRRWQATWRANLG